MRNVLGEPPRSPREIRIAAEEQVVGVAGVDGAGAFRQPSEPAIEAVGA
jgi:hypothetical protein